MFDATDIRDSDDVTGLTVSVSLDALLAVREGILARAAKARETMLEITEMTSRFGGRLLSDVAAAFRTRHGREGNTLLDDRILEHVEEETDKALWRYMLDRSGIGALMDVKTRQEWDKQVEKSPPKFTRENVVATFEKLSTEKASIFDQSVLNVFRALCRDYRTNSYRKFGKKIILNHFASAYGTGEHLLLCIDNYKMQEIDDLIRVMTMLDGKAAPDSTQRVYYACNQAQQAGEQTVETEYLHLRWYKKGSCHIVFKRPDLVDKMNKVLVKHHPNALPAAS